MAFFSRLNFGIGKRSKESQKIPSLKEHYRDDKLGVIAVQLRLQPGSVRWLFVLRKMLALLVFVVMIEGRK